MTNIVAQTISLAKELKQIYLNEPENYSRSDQYQKIQCLLKNMQTSHFIIPAQFPQTPTQGRIYQEQNLRVSIFFVPKGTKIPIHDHPNMNVICKVLKGKFEYTQYTLNDKSHQIKIPMLYMKSLQNNTSVEFPCIEAQKTIKYLKSQDIGYITPEVNLHKFEALQDSIFIDVICPDYDKKQIFLNLYQQLQVKDNNKDVLLKMNPPRLTCLPMIKIEPS